MHEKENPVVDKQEHGYNSEQLEDIGAKQHEVLQNRMENQETDSESNNENDNDAHEIASKLASKADKEKQKKSEESSIERHSNRGAPSRKQLKDSFNNQMNAVRGELGIGGKITSKIMHNPVVETVSDFASSTFARPNSLLIGSMSAFIAVAILYILAKHYGFQLSGFETIAAFIIGWLIGMLYDYLKTIFSKRKN